MRLLLVLAGAACLVVSSADAAHAAPIVAAVAAVAGAFGALGGFGQALVGLALSFGMQALSTALAPKPERQETKPGAVQIDLVAEGGVAREIGFGRFATAGHLVHHNVYGDPDDEDLPNRYLQIVFALSDWECHALRKVWVDGEECALEAITPRDGSTADAEYGIDGYKAAYPSPLIRVRFFRGRLNQAADAELVAFSDYVEGASGPKRWTADHRLAGITYVSLTLDYKGNEDTDSQYFPGGVPEFIWELDGAVLYDPRKDSTVAGGAGPHRWSDVSTWEFSRNPAICAYNYKRGFHRNGVRILGMGVPAQDLLVDTYMAAANVCDEAAPEGGALYQCSVIASEDDEHRAAISAFVDAMAGQVYERAGLFAIHAGAARTTVATLTDDDLVAGADLTFSAKLPRAELGNWFGGSYTEPRRTWSEKAFTPLHPAEWREEDGGEKIEWPLDLRSISDRAQALRVRKIRAEEIRCQARATITVGFRWLKLEPGDWIRKDFYGTAYVWRIEGRTLNADLTITLNLRQIKASAYDGVVDEEEDITQIRPQKPGRLKKPRNLAVEAFTRVKDLPSGKKQRRPALRIIYKPIKDKQVRSVVIQVRPVGEPDDKTKVVDHSPEDGRIVVMQGIQAGVAYEVRATLRCRPDRLTEWTDWVSTETGEEIWAPNASEADRAHDIDDLVVTAAKIRDLQIETRHIKDAQITARTIKDLEIEAIKLKDLTITAAKIAALAIDATKIANLTITGAKIAAAAISGDKIGSLAIDATKIANLTIDASKIANLTIVAGKIADLNITTGKLAGSAVTNAKLGAGAVLNSNLGDAQVGTSKMIDGAVSTIALGVNGSPAEFGNGGYGTFAQANYFNGSPCPAMIEAAWIIDGGSPYFQQVQGAYRRVTFQILLRHSNEGSPQDLVIREFEMPIVGITNDSPQRTQHWGCFSIVATFTAIGGGTNNITLYIKGNQMQGYTTLRHLYSAVKVTLLRK